MRIYPRWQQANIREALSTRRVLLLSGARQCGKTTLAKAIGDEDTEYRTLDDLTLKQAAESDPHGFVKHSKHTLKSSIGEILTIRITVHLVNINFRCYQYL